MNRQSTEVLTTTETATTPTQTDRLHLLSRKLAELDQRGQREQETTTPLPNSSTETLDNIVYRMKGQVEALTDIVNKLIVVNKLAYVDLKQRIDTISIQPR